MHLDPRPLGEKIELPPLPSVDAPSLSANEDIVDRRLRNGVRFVSVVRKGAPMAHVIFGIDRGTIDAPAGVAEVAGLAISLADPYGLDGTFAHEHLDILGASLAATASSDATIIRVSSLSELLPSVIERVLPLLAAPDYSEASVKLAAMTLATRRTRDADVRAQAGSALFAAMFPPPQSRAVPPGVFGATASTFRSVDPRQVRAFGDAFVSAEHAFVVVAGDFDPERVVELIERSLAKLPNRSNVPPPSVPLPATRSSCHGRTLVVDRPGLAQATVVVGATVPSPVEEGAADMAVFAEAAAGGLDSRLARRLRADLGITYGVHTNTFSSRFNGVMTISTSVEVARTSEALRVLTEELDRLTTEPVDARELTVAKLRALHDEGGASTASLALRLALDVGSGLEPEQINRRDRRIRSVSSEDVRATGARELDRGRRCVVILGDRAKLGPVGER